MDKMAREHSPADFSAWRGHAVGQRSVDLRALSHTQRQHSAAVRRRAEMYRLKAHLTVQFAITLCHASDEQRSRWSGLAEQAQRRRDEPHDELLARRVRARLRSRLSG